jgi:aminoglycoside N3'-acetyltransferase
VTDYDPARLADDLRALGVASGDRVLVRAGLKAIGPIKGGAAAFVDALLQAVGEDGTVVSLAFTDSSFIRRPRVEDAFAPDKTSNAGAVPNAMLRHPAHRRSRHPMCSYVAIGRDADLFVVGHDETSRAYEPVRGLLDSRGKCLLVGCVSASPGFTTAHLAEADLGLHRRVVLPQLNSTYYRTESGDLRLFRRRDMGLCSMSFHKFYAHYVAAGILRTGYVGDAYAILAPALAAYQTERAVLERDPGFGVCDSPTCFMCNAGRWDRLYRLPAFVVSMIVRKLARRGDQVQAP